MCFLHIIFCTVYMQVVFFALSGARSQECHSPRHLCCGDVTIKKCLIELYMEQIKYIQSFINQLSF